MEENQLKRLVQSCFEARYLKRIQRSGNQLFLGSDIDETIVEHSFYVSLFGVVLSHLDSTIDQGKLLSMCIIHDLGEVRCGDFNQANQLYGSTNEGKAFNDMRSGSGVGSNLIGIFEELEAGLSPEAKMFKDCDLLAQMLAEKEYLVKGYEEANERIEWTLQRIKTPLARQLGEYIVSGRMSARREEIKNNIRTSRGFPAKNYDL